MLRVRPQRSTIQLNDESTAFHSPLFILNLYWLIPVNWNVIKISVFQVKFLLNSFSFHGIT